MSAACPICSTPTHAKRDGTPYWMCPGCGAWFQHPAPPKVYFGPHESAADVMSDDEKAANAHLAGELFTNLLKGRPGAVLDIGSRYPFLAHTLAGFGCEAFGMEPGGCPPHDLNVAEFDADIEKHFTGRRHAGRYRLITLVHVFEHLYDPVKVIKKLRRLIAADGRVFIRLPDYNVAGFERDLNPGHYTIHPFFHSLTSVAECLARAGTAFVIEDYQPMQPGQSNIVLRPITKRPTIGLGMIVKNEERDLPRLLKSIERIVDGGIILDTGSTDKTRDIAMAAHFSVANYYDASEQIDGDWKLINFAQARNEYVKRVAAMGYDWLFWCDADDELITPLAVHRARYYPPWALGMWIDLGGGIRQVHYRMWPTTAPITFRGWCHEYPVLGATHAPVMNDVCIRHDAAPGIGETSNARNLRILEAQYRAEPDARCAFYLANTHKDGHRWRDAVRWYHVRLSYNDDFRDERLFALLYLARCLRSLGDIDAAAQATVYALDLAPDWQEFRMELAFQAYDRKDYKTAIDESMLALDRTPPATVLWREKDKYSDAPARLISWAHQMTGDLANAIAWSEVAANRIPGADAAWTGRHRGLLDALRAPPAPALVTRARRKVALVRPGAIGDILMTLNLLPAFLDANPDTDVHYFCAPQFAHEDALGAIIAQAGALPMDVNGLAAWRKSYDKVIDLVGYPLAEGYPEKPMRRHLLEYFGAEMGVEGKGAQLVIPRPPRPSFAPKGDYLTLQPEAGWSKYKQWHPSAVVEDWISVTGMVDWDIPYLEALGDFFGDDDDSVPVAFIGSDMDRTLAQSIALFANARMHLGIDSFCNHLTNYLWSDDNGARRVPGVILWGSTQASAAGYPDNINISLGLPCQPCFRENPEISRQPRGPCVNPPRSSYADNTPWACMAGIGAEYVAAGVMEMWTRTAEPVPTFPTA